MVYLVDFVKGKFTSREISTVRVFNVLYCIPVIVCKFIYTVQYCTVNLFCTVHVCTLYCTVHRVVVLVLVAYSAAD